MSVLDVFCNSENESSPFDARVWEKSLQAGAAVNPYVENRSTTRCGDRLRQHGEKGSAATRVKARRSFRCKTGEQLDEDGTSVHTGKWSWQWT